MENLEFKVKAKILSILNEVVSRDGQDLLYTEPGLIFHGPEPNELFYNREAIDILAYPSPLTNGEQMGPALAKNLVGLFEQKFSNDSDFAETELTSGRRQYRCTRYLLNSVAQAGKTAVILIERVPPRDITIQ
jgi:hypothetical protein